MIAREKEKKEEKEKGWLEAFGAVGRGEMVGNH